MPTSQSNIIHKASLILFTIILICCANVKAQQEYLSYNAASESEYIENDYTETEYITDESEDIQRTDCTPYLFTETARICDNKTYLWHGNTYKNLSAGTYTFYDSLLTHDGCDSVYKLILTIVKHNTSPINAFICQGNSYYFAINGSTYSSAGTYSVFKQLDDECETEYLLTVVLSPSYHFYDTVTICDNETYTWRDVEFYPSDADEDIQDMLKTKLKCDSVYHLTLRVSPTYLISETHTICAGDTFYWHGRALTQYGIYIDSLSSQANGCDSVHRLVLSLLPSYSYSDTVTICSNDSLVWRGRTLKQTGVYYDSLKTPADCDSVYSLVLTVNQAYFFQEYDTLCVNDTLLWHGQTLTKAGIYYDSLKTAQNCDSVYVINIASSSTVHLTTASICDGDKYYYTENGQYYSHSDTVSVIKSNGGNCAEEFRLILTVNPSYNFYDTLQMCDNDVISWRTHTYQSLLPGTYTYKDSFQTQHGCDSIYHLTLTVLQSYLFVIQDTICDNETYPWFGQTLSQPKSYFTILTTHDGCDSTYQLDLAVAPTYIIDEYDTICDNQPLTWHGQTLNAGGVYYDSLQSTHGCDSVHRLFLTINDTYFFDEYDTICDEDTKKWHGQTLTVGGTYYDSLSSKHGCDSIYRLSLHVLDVYNFVEYDTICDNQPFMWHGQTLTLAGPYFAMYTTQAGCDSIYQLNLYVADSYFFQEYDTICDNQSLTWHGQTLTTAGTYYDSLQSVNGCDSVYWLDLTVHQTYFFQEYDTICDNQSLAWHGQTLTAAGMYYDSLKSVNGCDSVYWLDLFVASTYFFQEYDTICDNQSLTWHGQTLTTAGTYYDSLKSVNGCDSVYWMNLTVHQTYFYQAYDTICDNQSLTWHGQTLTIAGTYYDSLKSVNGCDSVYWLDLTVHQTYFFQEYDTLCDNQSLTWHGQTLTVAGTYYDSLQSVNGCDSVYWLDLTVHQTYFFQEYDTICDNQSLTWHGQTLTTAGTSYDSLQSSNGCDSVYWIDLTVHPTYFFQEYDTISDNQTLTWHGQTLTTAGTYYDSLQSANGCDSVYHIDLTVHATFHYQEYDTICDNQTLTWHGQTLNAAGSYYDSLLTVNGSDSIYWLDLTVHQTYFFQEYDTICDNQSLTWHGQTLTAAGTYHDSLQSVNGCDSVYWLTLTVHPTYFFQQYDTICDNQSLTWHGQTLTTAGTYHDSLQTVNGCDSVYWMNLTVHQTYFSQEYDTICDNQTLTWHGQTLTTAGTYYDSLQSVNGCDSVYWLDLTVHQTYFFQEYDTMCDNHSLVWHGQTLTSAGIYYDSLHTANGCDSVYRIDLYTHLSYFIQLYDTICDNQTLAWHGQTLTTAGMYYDSLQSVNGCDSVYWLDLFVAPTYFFQEYDTICANKPLAWHGQTLALAGNYYDSLQSVYGCDSVYWINLYVYPNYLFQAYDTICNQDTFQWRGMEFTQAGAYFDSLLTVDGCDSVYQLILYVHPTYFFHILDTICDNQTLPWHGQVLSTAGRYYDSLKTVNGCDSVYWLDLTIMPTYFFQEYDTVCDNQPLMWHGQSLSATGTYYDSLQSVFGCDSVYWIDILAYPTYNIYDTVTICTKDLPYYYAPEDTTLQPTIFPVSNYQFHHTTVLGCDSIVYLRFIVYDTFSFHVYDTICQWDPYTRYGFNLAEQDDAGDFNYDLELVSSHGCDSTIHLHLHVKQSYDVQLYDVVCQGYAYHKDGFILPPQYQSGELIYQQFLTSKENCDSIITLNLSVTDLDVEITQVDGDLCDMGFVTLEVQSTLLDFVWSTGDTSRQIVVDNSGRYTVHVYSGECSADAGFTVEPCELELYIPNAFTPSRIDGINDYFYISWPTLSNVAKFEIFIYDRWGKLTFYSDDPYFQWDGKVKGKIQVNDVFTYKVFILGENGFDYVYKGTITVL